MRHAWPAKQCCWLGSSRYPFCCRVAFTNSNNFTNSYIDTNGNGYAFGYGYCYTNSKCNGDGYGHGQCYANSHGYAYH
jgi:hypothetical protein